MTLKTFIWSLINFNLRKCQIYTIRMEEWFSTGFGITVEILKWVKHRVKRSLDNILVDKTYCYKHNKGSPKVAWQNSYIFPRGFTVLLSDFKSLSKGQLPSRSHSSSRRRKSVDKVFFKRGFGGCPSPFLGRLLPR